MSTIHSSFVNQTQINGLDHEFTPINAIFLTKLGKTVILSPWTWETKGDSYNFSFYKH